MIKAFSHIIKRNLSLMLLGFFVFSFLHSELGFLDFDGEIHSTHDYCELVKNTNAHQKTLREELPKLELNKDYCAHSFEENTVQLFQNIFSSTDHHIIKKQSTEVYIFNRAFLI